MDNRFTTTMLENLAKKRQRSRLLKRALALLSAVVLLFTMNSLKFQADTLERIPMCGLEEHVHGEECYNSLGMLVCSLEEHVHTDACYQERPKKLEGTGLELDDESAIDDDLEFDLTGSAPDAAKSAGRDQSL